MGQPSLEGEATMATYRLPRMLTLLAWEAELRRGPYATDPSWSNTDPESRLYLDFSRVEFADFGALARALLLLDAAVKSGVSAVVTLPTTAAFLTGEETGGGPTLAERRARARADALVFMRQVGFLDSLRAPHWGKNPVRILDGAVPVVQEPGSSPGLPESDPHNSPYQRRRVFPLRWLEPMPAAQLRESESFNAVAAGLEDLGLPRADAQTLSQTVLTELVENVAEHGSDSDRPPVALVGAIMVSADNYTNRQSGINEHMTEVAERAQSDNSHVLRLIVADSGADLVARLAPEIRAPENGQNPEQSRRDTILSALGMRSAGSVGKDGKKRGPTGLWWVARVVRTYRGGVQARTADLMAGLLFGQEPDGTGVFEDDLSYVPGTLLELTLPTGPSPPRSRAAWGSASVHGTAPGLQWVNCFFDPERGLTDADRALLIDRIRGSHLGQRPDGLIITIPLPDSSDTGIDDRWRAATQQVLEYATSIARWGPVVLAFPDAQPNVLGPCVAAFNEELDAAPHDDARGPILVLDCHGEPAWCGGEVPLRAVFGLLSEHGGTVDMVEAGECWQKSGGEPSQFPAALRASRRLLNTGTTGVELRLSPSGVHETVARAVDQRVAEAISANEQGVTQGAFRGPTLRVTDRWISVKDLLTATIGTSLAAFVLARKAEMALRVSTSADTLTGAFQVGSTPRPLVRHISECLSLDGRFYSQQSELNVGEPPISEQVPAGTRLVLCTDLISTENTVRRAVGMVAAGEADPLVITCVVDARDGHQRGPVRLLNRVIPVVSLTEVEVEYAGSANGKITDIDPLMLQPTAPSAADASPGDGLDLLNWCATGLDVLRLGHIDDPPRRHYSAFFRLQAMHQQEGRDEIAEAVLADVRWAFADIETRGGADTVTGGPLDIWFVSSDGNAGTMARTVHDGLTTEGFQVDAITPIPRWAAGESWAFPDRLSTAAGSHGVLIIHWWAITGSTLMHLIRLAARSGANWIAAVCVLNQMDNANDADSLLMMRTVSGTPATDDPTRELQVPISIRFVAVSQITSFTPHDCPMCATRERYLINEDSLPPRLFKHAELLRDMLRPRELDEVARDSAADLFTVPVTALEAADYLRWRGLLLQARRMVSDRQELIDRLRALADETPDTSEWTSAGLIRLLAAEQHWLRHPPLYFQVGSDLLSQACVRSFEQLTAPLWLRVQALMVMSATVPQRLVELLTHLLASAGNEAVLVDQMLLDCCRLLLRVPGNSPIDVTQLRRNLHECRDYLEKQRGTPDANVADDHLHAVRDLLTIADYRILSKPRDPQDAWERLSEDLARPVERHGLEAGLLLVRNFVEDVEGVAPSAKSARAAETDWDACVRQLEERALANLPPLRQILAGDFVSDWLGSRDQRRLLTLARPDVGELREVTDRLHALAYGPWRPSDPSWRTVRRELLDRLNWWHRTFLAAHLADHEMPALLVELIRSAPTKPTECLAEILSSHHVNATVSGADHGTIRVFCPEKLLEQVIAHVLENTEKHRIKGASCRLHVAYKPPEQNGMRIVVRNSGTVACIPRGRGLEALNDKLRPFGGSLRGKEVAEDEWTFAADIKLPLWHGG
jgi:hypothetical protein